MNKITFLLIVIFIALSFFINKTSAQSNVSATVSEQSQSLFAAVKNSDIKEVKDLLDNGANPNALDNDGDNVLMNAAMYASVDCMKLLLQKGADPNTKNLLGETPIMFCAHDAGKVKQLLKNGADINAKTKWGNTALLIAVAGNGQYDIIKMMLEKGADPLLKNVNLETTLMRAALFSDTAIISLLLEKGVDINAQDKDGQTALLNAIINSNKLCALKLLESGANPELRIITSSIQALPSGTTALSAAVIFGDIDIVSAILKKTKDVNAMYEDGHTALMWATYNDHDNSQVIQALLDKGADPNIKFADGSTALSWALKKGNTATVELLRKAGAKE